MLFERNRSRLRHDDVSVSAHGVEPITELFGVRDRRRQRNETHRRRQMDDDLLPHCTAEPVGEVMDFVHDDIAQVAERR